MKSRELVVGERYRLRYREFTQTGNCSYGQPLIDGEGVLVSMYDVSRYNHTFKLDDGSLVWATPNSVFKIEKDAKSNSTILVDDIIGDLSSSSKDAQAVKTFLSGLAIECDIVKEHLVISPNSIANLKKLIYRIYSEIL
jgi:hypothetical protein